MGGRCLAARRAVKRNAANKSWRQSRPSTPSHSAPYAGSRLSGVVVSLPDRTSDRGTELNEEYPAEYAVTEAVAASPPVAAAIVTSSLGILAGRRKDGRPPLMFIAGELKPNPQISGRPLVKGALCALRAQVAATVHAELGPVGQSGGRAISMGGSARGAAGVGRWVISGHPERERAAAQPPERQAVEPGL